MIHWFLSIRFFCLFSVSQYRNNSWTELKDESNWIFNYNLALANSFPFTSQVVLIILLFIKKQFIPMTNRCTFSRASDSNPPYSSIVAGITVVTWKVKRRIIARIMHDRFFTSGRCDLRVRIGPWRRIDCRDPRERIPISRKFSHSSGRFNEPETILDCECLPGKADETSGEIQPKPSFAIGQSTHRRPSLFDLNSSVCNLAKASLLAVMYTESSYHTDRYFEVPYKSGTEIMQILFRAPH